MWNNPELASLHFIGGWWARDKLQPASSHFENTADNDNTSEFSLRTQLALWTRQPDCGQRKFWAVSHGHILSPNCLSCVTWPYSVTNAVCCKLLTDKDCILSSWLILDKCGNRSSQGHSFVLCIQQKLFYLFKLFWKYASFPCSSDKCPFTLQNCFPFI